MSKKEINKQIEFSIYGLERLRMRCTAFDYSEVCLCISKAIKELREAQEGLK